MKPSALVTGASRGIGAAVAERLAADGFHVILNYSASQGRAEEVAARITARGGSVALSRFDVANSDEVDAALEKAATEFGPLAVLVNNAGIALDGLLARMKNEDLDRTIDVDLKGAIFCTRAAARQMMRARSGSIIQISSVIGEMGNAGQAAYSAAKAGLLGFTKSVAKELASRGVRCNAITPGFIQTEMTAALTEAQKEAILRQIPLGSLGLPEDVAACVSFLASPQSRYVTGQVLGVSGGLYM